MAAPVATYSSLGQVTGLAATVGSGTGSLPAGTYYYKVIAVSTHFPTNANLLHQGPSSAEVSITITTGQNVDLNWTAVAGAGGYVVFRTTVSGNYDYYADPSGNVFNGMALRALYYRSSTSTNTFTDDGSIAPNSFIANTNWRSLSISDEIPLIEITGGDSTTPASMEWLYDQDVLNGWGVITKTGSWWQGWTYEVRANIVLNPTIYWEEEPYNNTWILHGNFVCSDTADLTSTILLGRIVSALNTPVIGPNIKLIGDRSYANYTRLILAGGDVQLYGVDFETLNLYFWEGYQIDLYNNNAWSYQAGDGTVELYGAWTMRHGSFLGAPFSTKLGGGEAFVMERVDNFRGSRGFTFSGDMTTGSIIDIEVAASTNGLELGAGDYVTMRNSNIQGGSALARLTGGNNQLTLIDCSPSPDPLTVQWWNAQSSSPYGVLRIGNTVNMTILNSCGDPIANAEFKVTDSAGNIVIDTTSDSSGVVSEQDIIHTYCEASDNTIHMMYAGEVQDRNPFTFRVSAEGYETVEFEISISEEIRGVIELRHSPYIGRDGMGMEFR